jgi:hypothetical protein
MRLALAALVVALAGPATAAAEGIYFTENVGGTDVKDELAANISAATRIRVALGYRIDKLAFEAWAGFLINDERYSGYEPSAPANAPACEITTPDKPWPCHDYGYTAPPSDSGSTDFFAWGMDVKYLQPVSKHVEVYLRGGLSKGYADGIDASGRGLGIGAGAQVKGKVPALGLLFWPFFFTNFGPKMTGALYVDTSYEFYRLHGPRRTTDAQLSHLTLGFAFGSDF